jgi:ABC-2 type transport system permease protein
VLSLATDAAQLDQQTLAAQAALFGGELPFFVQDWFALLVLLGWVAVPLGVALVQFDRIDL